MSTLMSRDLNLTRSSTRVRDPPGGKSSISFGDEYSAPVPSRNRGQYDPSSGKTVALNFGNEYSAPVRNHGEYSPQDRHQSNASQGRQQSNNDYGRQQQSNEYAAPVRNQGQFAGRQQASEYAAPVRNQGQYGPQSKVNNITSQNQYEDASYQRASRRPSTSPDKSSMKGVVNQSFSDYQQETPARNYRQAPGGRSSIVIG